MNKRIDYLEMLKAKEAAFQQQAREKSAKDGKNPDTIFAISHIEAFDMEQVLKVIAYHGPKEIADRFDGFIFDFLELLSRSEENNLTTDSQYTILLLKQIRDALLKGKEILSK